MEGLDLRAAPEGTVPGQHFPEHHSEREDVGPAVDRLAAHLFRAHVSDGPGDHTGLGQEGAPRGLLLGRRGDRGLLGQSEVEDPGETGGVQDDVLRLDVAMDDPFVVRRGQALRDLRADLGGFARRKRPPREPGPERLAVDQLGDGVAQSPFFAHVEERDDVRVREGSDGPRLLLEPLDVFGIGCEGRRKDLDRDVAAEARVRGAVDLAHAAPSELASDFVGAEACPG